MGVGERGGTRGVGFMGDGTGVGVGRGPGGVEGSMEGGAEVVSFS